ncbi:glycoside hydrolase family 3 N-terminal domain-containing protein [Bacteroides sp. 51]|uniref:glycoside hydrolase family 3 N-terminal domain-containing protein n=1 Tax=Bacteroides sp. 51 TaxID=2302938 RepID=UPI0013D4359F|nr:glycoside hydrolase family 3 N-terminal domain-containing protein [Bacteroides sp. 51]NDV83237.1 beta-glucosidase [Bacteroides sp. 51]
MDTNRILKPAILLSLFFLLFTSQVKAGKGDKPAYLDSRTPVEQRITDLMGRMTLEEKVAQMCQYVGLQHMRQAEERRMNSSQMKSSDAWAFYPGMTAKDIEDMVSRGEIGSFLHVLSAAEANKLQRLAMQSRLRIPLLIGIDAVHGNGMVPGSTVYPSPIGLSCTWDTTLVRRTAAETALEMRATGFHWTFSPNLDVARDARWGRVGETFGEDTHLVTAMGVSTIKGLQGEDFTGTTNVIACAKHLVAGSEPINGLNVAPSDLSERTLWDVYYPPFKAAVDAGVFTAMPAHNEINGIACHASKYLMTDLLRNKWGFKGFYISDFKDIERLAEVHRVAADQKEAVYKSVMAGMDMHMHGPEFLEPILEMIEEGKLTEGRIDEAVRKILEVKFRLGLFENPYIDEKQLGQQLFTPNHQQTALEATRKSIVLLKNSDSILPLGAEGKRILVTGPNANNQAMLGDWSAIQPAGNIVTVVDGIRKSAGHGTVVNFHDTGDAIPQLSHEKIAAAKAAAMQNDIIIAVIGENALRSESVNRNSGENIDRDNIDPAGLQNELIEELCKTGKPVIVVLINGRPLSIGLIQQKAKAIVEAWEPGSFGGQAIGEVIFGKVNPSGKLSISFPRSVGQIPVFYNHKPSQYVRKYLRTSSEPLYTFGDGLSYTTYEYSEPVLDKSLITPGESVNASVEVRNTGKRDGDEVVQLYLRYPIGDVTRAVRELKGFRRIHLKAGEKKQVTFTLTPQILSSYDAEMNFKVDEGEFTIMVGGSSRDAALKTNTLKVAGK